MESKLKFKPMNWLHKKKESLLKNSRTHWQWYRVYFQLNVFRYFMIWFAIVPFIAVLFGGINQTIKIGMWETTIHLHEKLPFNWELIWFASILFIIAWVFYIYFCPIFIRNYPTLTDYLKHGHSPRWLVWESQKIIEDSDLLPKFFQRMYEKKYVIDVNDVGANKLNYPIVTKDSTIIYFEHKSKYYSFSMPLYDEKEYSIQRTEIAVTEIFWEIFGRYSSSHKNIRLTILILFSISLSMVAITIGQNIVNGIKIIF